MKKTLLAAAMLSLFASASFAQAASAPTDTKFQANHPRREEVNNRLANQNARIKSEVAEGEMSKAKAARLHKADLQIRQEERDMASQNSGHITKLEQRTLNQQENKVSRQIGK